MSATVRRHGIENVQSFNESKFVSQSPVSQSQSGRVIFPISHLNLNRTRWTIRARVTSKFDIKDWSNPERKGRLFVVHLMDESSEIRVVCFDDLVDKFYPLLEQNKVYYISNGKLDLSKRIYSSIENEYELKFNYQTKIELCTEDHDLPTQKKFNFLEIGKIPDIELNCVIDVIGVCSHTFELLEQVRSGEQISKRDITLVDQTAHVNCTLWRKEAEDFDQYRGSNPIVAIKGVKVSAYGGRSLSLVYSSVMHVNPENLQEALFLRRWYKSFVSSENITSLPSRRVKEIDAIGSEKPTQKSKKSSKESPMCSSCASKDETPLSSDRDKWPIGKIEIGCFQQICKLLDFANRSKEPLVSALGGFNQTEAAYIGITYEAKGGLGTAEEVLFKWGSRNHENNVGALKKIVQYTLQRIDVVDEIEKWENSSVCHGCGIKLNH